MKHPVSVLGFPLACLLSSCGAAEAPQAPPLFDVERTIPLDKVSGRIDHLTIDLRHRRLFVAELGNGSVDAVDLDTGASRRITGLKEPQGLAFLADRNELAVADGGDGSLHFFDGDSLAPRGAVALGQDADNVRRDSVSGAIAVGYGDGGIAFVDPARRAVARTIALPAHPEGFQLDPASARLFVNLPDAHAVAWVDAKSGTVARRLPAAHGQNFPLAFDAPSHAIAIAYRSPARLVLLDDRSGALRQDLDSCGDADDLFFDDPRQRLYVICGAGEVDVFERRGGAFQRVSRVPTRQGARTGLFVPELDRLIIAARAAGKSPAALIVLRPK